MNKAHLTLFALLVAGATILGAVAVTRTTGLGRAARHTNDAAVAARTKQLASYAAKLQKELKAKPPALPPVPKPAPAVASAAAPAAAPAPQPAPRIRRQPAPARGHGRPTPTTGTTAPMSRMVEEAEAAMTSHHGRLYAIALALVVFFLAWAVVAARPWATASADPRLRTLTIRQAQLQHEAKLVQKVVAARWARYRVRLKARLNADRARQRGESCGVRCRSPGVSCRGGPGGRSGCGRRARAGREPAGRPRRHEDVVKTDPTFWLLARASGLTAYGLLTASVLAGLTLKSKPFGRALKPAPTMGRTPVPRAARPRDARAARRDADARQDVAHAARRPDRPGRVSVLRRGGGRRRGRGGADGADLRLIRPAKEDRPSKPAPPPLGDVPRLPPRHRPRLRRGTDSTQPWAHDFYLGAVGAVAFATAWRALGRPTRPVPERSM